jgi:hypothetical protein
MDLAGKLRYVFPYARSIDVVVPQEEDGSFVAELVLPVKNGDSVVQVYRFPGDEEEFRHEDKLTWQTAGAVPSELDGRPVPRHKTSFGAARWGFFASWDGVASYEEVRALVVERLVRYPLTDGESSLSPSDRPGT